MALLDDVNLDEFDFDSPDEPAGMNRRKGMRKVVIRFEDYNEDAFEARFGTILTEMDGNPDFVEPWFPVGQGPTLASLQARKTSYSLAKAAAEDGDAGAIATRIAEREAATADLKKLGNYVNLVADGDVAMLEGSGFELSKEPAPRMTEPPGIPQEFKVARTDISGQVKGSVKKLDGAGALEGWICTGDPAVEANWRHHVTSVLARKIMFTGLTAGTVYYFRVRGIGSAGPGGWSDIAQLMAT